RASGAESRELFDLYLFDETDSTISQYGKTATELIFFGLKQVSHQNMGLILIGQSPNASNYNSQRADWENAISIHIGSAAKHAIEKDDTLTADDKNSLKKQADIIADYCAEQNKKNGFIVEGDSQSSQGYRYAWVREPNKHYWIQLPEFGCYTFDQLDSVYPPTASASETASEVHPTASELHPEAENPYSVVHLKAPSPTYLGMQCPKCNSGTLTGTKKNRGKTLYLCNECGKSTSESVLAKHYRQKLEDLLPDEGIENDDD
ncbi:hypothetical protein, partial [Okeania sp. SIO1I7]|uniref:hypothetical protein n=1 Tax=Okeania sp. SIO1I7 TaxID=2607772 RepID=UPI0013F79BAE